MRLVKLLVKKFALVGLIFLLIIVAQIKVNAQTQGDIRLNLISTQENQDEMLLKLYFNLIDPSTGKTFTTLNADNAQITLLYSGFVSPATIKEPDIPIYVTLLLDSSGSMSGMAQKMQQAAKLSLNNPPEDAFFGVVQFDEEIKLLQDFTENIPAASFSIDQYKVSNKGTCLYDAAYATVEAQTNAPPGRRGVILFTDGNDAKPGSERCSKHTYQELVNFAISMQVPIHTIGLTGPNSQINEIELRSMAGSTGGFSYIAQEDDLADAFVQIMDTIKAQWMVEASVYPKNGLNEAVFLLSLVEGETLNTAFTFDSDTDYPGPPSLVQMRFDGLRLIAETQSYDIQMALTSPELVGYVKISLWDSDAGSKVADFIFEELEEFNTFVIPTNEMAADREYELRIIAVNKEDNIPFAITADDQGRRKTEYIHEFRFDPSSINASAEITSVSQEGSDLILNISLTNPRMIGGFDGWLVDKATNTQVTNSTFYLPSGEVVDGRIVVPTRENRVPSGKYMVVLRVLNANDQVLMTTQFDDIAYNAPGLFRRISSAMITQPIFLVIIIGIILALIAFLMITSMRQKSLTGTPVMQGQIGSSGKGKGKFSSLAVIATDEPMREGKQPSSPVKKRQGYQSASVSAYSEDPTKMQPGQHAVTILHDSGIQLLQPYLIGIKGPKGGTLMVDSLPYTIGRADADLVLDNPSISRRHAQIIAEENNQYYLVDLNSSNGTRLNGQLIRPGVKNKLANGDQIDLGREVTFKFELR
jgi:VWFA-related protein